MARRPSRMVVCLVIARSPRAFGGDDAAIWLYGAANKPRLRHLRSQ